MAAEWLQNHEAICPDTHGISKGLHLGSSWVPATAAPLYVDSTIARQVTARQFNSQLHNLDRQTWLVGLESLHEHSRGD